MRSSKTNKKTPLVTSLLPTTSAAQVDTNGKYSSTKTENISNNYLDSEICFSRFLRMSSCSVSVKSGVEHLRITLRRFSTMLQRHRWSTALSIASDASSLSNTLYKSVGVFKGAEADSALISLFSLSTRDGRFTCDEEKTKTIESKAPLEWQLRVSYCLPLE